MKDDLIRLARDMCVEKIGKVHCSYIDKILEHWHLDGIDTVEKAKADSQPAAKKKPQKETSLDMDAYMEQVMSRRRCTKAILPNRVYNNRKKMAVCSCALMLLHAGSETGVDGMEQRITKR